MIGVILKPDFFLLGLYYEETILNDFKNRVCRLTCLRRKSFEGVMPILGMFFDVYDLHGILDASRC